MDMKDLDRSLVKSVGFNPYYHALKTALGNKIRIADETYIDLASNNYLGLANREDIKEYASKILNKYGLSMCGTPIATGCTDLLRETEAMLASFVGTEDAIVFPSCYQANIGLFATLADSETVVIVDHYAHSSLLNGIQSSGAKIVPFLHNRVDHLEKCLKAHKNQSKKFVVTESVFSTEGSLAPFEYIDNLCTLYDAVLVVDDSHGIGILGNQGKGALNHFKLTDFKGLYTASLGKGLANIGGMIGGSKETLDYMRYYCPHLVYSTAITPVSLGGIKKTIEVLENEHSDIIKRATHYKNTLYHALVEAGFEVMPSETLINSIHSGSAENTFRISKLFFEERILTTPFVEPSVPPNKGKVRLIAGADLNPETVDEICIRIAKIGKIK